jgi:hypothetical protein
MSKSARKGVVYDFILEFKGTTDVATLTTLRNQIINQVTSCGYSDPQVYQLVIPTWADDLDRYIVAVEKNQAKELDQNTMLALMGLLNQIDMSQLPD